MMDIVAHPAASDPDKRRQEQDFNHLKMVNELVSRYPTLRPIQETNQLLAMMTILRDRRTPKEEFVFYTDRVIRLLIEHALNELPFEPKEVITPTGDCYCGVTFSQSICGVSVVRSGESMEAGLRAVCKGCRIGKILIQRNENTFKPSLIWHKLPRDIADRYVLLLEPMLASGGSAACAIEVLLQNGVKENRIILTSIVGAPVGIRKLLDKFPQITMCCAAIDNGLDAKAYITPGIGDFGDRYFGTDRGSITNYRGHEHALANLTISQIETVAFTNNNS